LSWSKKIEGQVGQVYLKGANIIYGRNWDLTFIEISSLNGDILNVLNPYTVEKEKKPLILDDTVEYGKGYVLVNVVTNNPKYSNVALKSVDRQYRGDTETFYLIVKTRDGKEVTILFNRKQFTFISDITYFKDGKFILTFNGEAGTDSHKYIQHIGLLDLDKMK